MNVFDLIPHGSNQKSYGGKAKVYTGNNAVTLHSYNTDVCMIKHGEFVRMWDGYSATTMKHVNSFRVMMHLPKLNKKEWEEIPVLK